MGFERVRRLNEPREETALCEVRECANCLYTIEGGGISLGQRWLHLTCVEVYIENLERARDRALTEAEEARAALAQIPPIIWSGSGGSNIPAGWQQVQYGTTYTVTLDPAGSSGVWTNAGSAMTFQSFPSVTTAATNLYTPTTYTTTTTSGLEQALGP